MPRLAGGNLRTWRQVTVMTAAAAVVAAALCWLGVSGVWDAWSAGSFAALIMPGEIFRITLPENREVSVAG